MVRVHNQKVMKPPYAALVSTSVTYVTLVTHPHGSHVSTSFGAVRPEQNLRIYG